MNGHPVQSDHSPGSDLLNWDNTVCAATALLATRYVLPDMLHHPALAREAQRLAALLCAYGVCPATTNHRRVAASNAGKPTTSTPASPHHAGAPTHDPQAGEFVPSTGIEQAGSNTFLGNGRGEST
jgi:hypothetical protein